MAKNINNAREKRITSVSLKSRVSKNKKRKPIILLALVLGIPLYYSLNNYLQESQSTQNDHANSALARVDKQIKIENHSIAKLDQKIQGNSLPKEVSPLNSFVQEGWKKVDAPEPNQALLDLNPEEVLKNEEEGYYRLSSSQIGPAHIANAKIIFQKTESERIRYRIIDGLGALELSAAQQALTEIYPSANSEQKLQIIDNLKSWKFSEAEEFLVKEISRNSKDDRQQYKIKKVAIGSIAAGLLYRQPFAGQQIMTKLSNEDASLLKQQIESLKKVSLTESHNHE